MPGISAFLLSVLLAGCAAQGLEDYEPSVNPPGSAVPQTPLPQPLPTASPSTTSGAQDPAIAPTTIRDRTAARRLRENSGVTLQWIGWDQRGFARVTVGDDGVYRLNAAQPSFDGVGGMSLSGVVTEIGSDYFLFDGRIVIVGTPDAERYCADNRLWRFGVTQNRKYWRLREFEWCDELTDYIDIYF
ncbi:hypothetical protein [Alteripontixanthobacter maritimus]|uniref:hypothetical protein n=1 Tax=Alteripontixanthobacter maritimus TaxID=2161824 RepID=UPI000E1B7D1E|nr:hypothetical protein [Alteripontixanthobacter maritimus]